MRDELFLDSGFQSTEGINEQQPVFVYVQYRKKHRSMTLVETNYKTPTSCGHGLHYSVSDMYIPDLDYFS